MKFSTTALTVAFGLCALVAAIPQNSDASSVESVAATTVSVPPAYASYLTCIEDCPEGDVLCQAQCQNIPTPDEGAVNATYTCVAECPRGSGTAEDNAAWGECQRSCVSSYYYSASVTVPYSSPGATAADATATSDSPNETGGDSSPSETENSEASSTGSGTGSPSATQTGAGSANSISIQAAGILGLFIAVLAL